MVTGFHLKNEKKKTTERNLNSGKFSLLFQERPRKLLGKKMEFLVGEVFFSFLFFV